MVAVFEGEALAVDGDMSPAAAAVLLRPIFASLNDKTLSPSHRASFSRSLDRLKARGLINRVRDTFISLSRNERRETVWTKHIELTEAGATAGAEVVNRVRDALAWPPDVQSLGTRGVVRLGVRPDDVVLEADQTVLASSTGVHGGAGEAIPRVTDGGGSATSRSPARPHGTPVGSPLRPTSPVRPP